jgi:S1-C subfamily serine protease
MIQGPIRHWVLILVLGIFALGWIMESGPALSLESTRANGAPPLKAENLYPMTFSKLLFRPTGSIELWKLPDNFALSILDVLRARGYNIVGAENILFNVEKSDTARMVLGGSILKFACMEDRLHNTRACDIALNWELFDIKKKQVVYKVETRARLHLTLNQKFTEDNAGELVRYALESLLRRPRFAEALTKKDMSDEESTQSAGTYKACVTKPLLLPSDMQTVLDASISISIENETQGSGVFFSDDGLILTAAHVVDDESTVTIEMKSGLSLTASVILRNKERDAAVLKVDGKGFACLSLADNLPAEGSDVFAVGSPLGDELKLSVSKGIVSGIPTVDDKIFIQTDAGLNPGNSGGPLVDSTGNVVGFVSQKIHLTEGLGFAVPIRSGMDSLGLTASSSTSLSPASRANSPVTSQIDQGKIVDVGDIELPSPDEVFEVYARESQPIRGLQGGGTALIVFGAMMCAGGTIAAAVTKEPVGIAVGAGVATLGLAGIVSGSMMVHSAKKKDARLIRQMRSPLISVAPLQDANGLTAAAMWRF